MLKAQAEGISAGSPDRAGPRRASRDLADMLIGLDNFGSTHMRENQAIAVRMYLALAPRATSPNGRSPGLRRQGEHVPAGPLREGHLPRCGAADQYGDSCEVCGATYSPADLKNPVSAISGTTPVERDSEHHFFRLSAFEDRLKPWVRSGAVQQSVAHKLDEWFSQGLKDWDISRDAPYFGFEIPGAPGKYFYVWFDAPIGYLASFTQLCARERLALRRFLRGRFDRRAAPFHRQGHPVFPCAVLARRARGRRHAQADGRSRPRVPHDQRPEDVEVPRARSSPRAAISTAFRPNTCGITSPRSSARASTIWT